MYSSTHIRLHNFPSHTADRTVIKMAEELLNKDISLAEKQESLGEIIE